MAEEPPLPAPPEPEPEEASERLMGAMGGGVASSVVHLPLLALPMWGRELALLADPAGTAESLAELTWSRALIEAPTVPPDLVRLTLHVSHAAMSMMVGLLAGAILRRLLPGRRSARAGAVAAFFYGIHPLHRPMLEHAANFPVALATCALGFAAFKAVEAASQPDRHRDDLELAGVCGLIGGLLAPFAGAVSSTGLALLAASIPRGPRRRMAALGAATAAVGAVVAIAFGPGGGPTGEAFTAGPWLRLAEGIAGVLGAPMEAPRRILGGAPIAGATLLAVGAAIHGLLVAMLTASSAASLGRGRRWAAGAFGLVLLGMSVLVGENARLGMMAILGIAYACIVALGFASHVRAKSLLFVLALAGSLFASEVERISPHPAALERARIAGSLQAALERIGREHATRRGSPIGEADVLAADPGIVADLGGNAGIARLLGEPGVRLVAASRPSGLRHVLRLTQTTAELECPAGE